MSLEIPLPTTRIKLQVQQYCGERPSENFLQYFDSFPIVIGRAETCDFVLIDVSKYISSKHAQITTKEGVFYIEDTSANGVYINGSIFPLGRGNTTALKNGDTLSMGDFRLLFEMENLSNQPASVDDSDDPTTEVVPVQAEADTQRTTAELTSTEKVFNDSQEWLKTELISDIDIGQETLGEQEPIPIDSPPATHDTAPAVTIRESDALDVLLRELRIKPDLVADMDSVTLLKGIGQLLDQSLQALRLLLNVTKEQSRETDQNAEASKDAAPSAFDAATKSKDAILLLLQEQYLAQNDKGASQNLRNRTIDSGVEKAISTMGSQQGVALGDIDAAIDFSLKTFHPQQLEKKLAASNKVLADLKQPRDAKLWKMYDQRYSEFVDLARASFYDKISDSLTETTTQLDNTVFQERQGKSKGKQ